jgi:anthranilate phosphoribosyltransferase
MSDEMKPILNKVADGIALSADEAEEAFGVIMSGDATAAQIAGFLMALRVRGETVDEITGAVRTMRAKMTRISAPEGAMDVVGTGGDGSGTFNISTGAAFVVAGAGVPVAKHGNRALSSKSGAADVLSSLGVNLEADFPVIEQAMAEAGIGFLMAPRHHSAMRFVGPVRVEMGVRTIFNILGPMSNPADVKRQFTGVFSKDWVMPMAETLRNLGCEAAWVVHGSDGLDELTTTGPTHVAALKDGEIREFEVSPTDVGIAIADPADLKGGNPEANAAALRSMLGGDTGAYRDIVLLNAGASLVVAGKADDLAAGVEMAAKSIDSGAALAALDKLVMITSG